MQAFTKMMMLMVLVAVCLADHDDPLGGNPSPQCKKMKDIYPSGKEICENMWGGAFKYEEDEENAYTMWFFDAKNNPNDKVSENLAKKGLFELEGAVDQCFLEYYHKGDGHEIDNAMHPTEEPHSFQECHPYSERSCCFQDTVSTVQKIKESYGKEYHWDRCGPLSQACERFFVMEACFYECEPNAGLYRKHKGTSDHPDPFAGAHPLYDPEDPNTNTWQMHEMPIKASFCNAWWTACAEDMFCSSDNGDFFSCAKEWVPFDTIAAEAAEAHRLPGSCEGSCGGKSKNGPCLCDDTCSNEHPITCCKDQEEYCKAVTNWIPRPLGSCKDACGEKTLDGDCYCDFTCIQKGDCCEDKDTVCSEVTSTGTCEGVCGNKAKDGSCYCDSKCKKNGDCCSDKKEKCPNVVDDDCSNGAC